MPLLRHQLHLQRQLLLLHPSLHRRRLHRTTSLLLPRLQSPHQLLALVVTHHHLRIQQRTQLRIGNHTRTRQQPVPRRLLVLTPDTLPGTSHVRTLLLRIDRGPVPENINRHHLLLQQHSTQPNPLWISLRQQQPQSRMHPPLQHSSTNSLRPELHPQRRHTHSQNRHIRHHLFQHLLGHQRVRTAN